MTPAQFIDDPAWADFLPEDRAPTSSRHLPSHEDCSPLDPETVAAFLAAGGTLASGAGYEERPGQLDMLKAIVRAFDARAHLMIEAGTGVGKSLAYLLPAVHFAAVNDTPVVVSTATRNLQSQLLTSDIPRALTTLGAAAGKFKVALLKGRGNYLCLRALGEFFSSGYWTMSADEQREMPHLIEWLKSTPDGDLDFYEGLPRALLTCAGEECGGRRCPYRSRCFVYRARHRAAEAHLVVVNHALVLASAANPASGILPAFARLVLDEAHDLEEIATEFFTREFSSAALARILSRLVRRTKARASRGAGGLVAAIDRQLMKGVLTESAAIDAIRHLLAAIPSDMTKLVAAADALAHFAARQLELKSRPVRFAAGRFGEGLKPKADAFDAAIVRLVKTLHDLADVLDASTPEGEFNFLADLSVQLKSVAEELIALANDTAFIFRAEASSHAYWGENFTPERRRAYPRFVAAPISVAEPLRETLYHEKDSVILCSATLRVGNDFKYMARRLGCAERFEFLTASSPFDYLRQAATFAPDFLPAPGAETTDAGYPAELAALLKRVFAAFPGRALVLFTSYEMMRAVAAETEGFLTERGLRLFVQGGGLSREAMVRELKAESARTVLFGASSFWEGVDIAGEALKCVIIARLPFAQRGDPIVEARGEAVERAGLSAFRDYFLPEAVIRFRQGFGRLIRSMRDTGAVIVADPRLVTKNYGATFRRSIPSSVHTVTSADELIERLRPALGN